MRVFVAGASGVIGRQLVPRLVEQGHEVTASTRSREKSKELRALGAKAVVMDGLDAASVGRPWGGPNPEVVVHQMTALAGVGDLRRSTRGSRATNALRTRGTEHLLAAAAPAGVRRFVAQSYAGWPSARAGSPVKTEDDPWDPDPPAPAAASARRDPVPRAGGERRAARGDRSALR